MSAHTDATLDALRARSRDADIQVVGALPEHLAVLLPCSTEARSVFLSRGGIEHIFDRRRPADAEFALAHLHKVIYRPIFWGDLATSARREPHRISLVELIEPDNKYLHVAVKIVLSPYSDSGQDEIWVCTAFLLGQQSLRKYLKTGKLKPIIQVGI